MIVVIDFDGTIVEDAYPEIGLLRRNAKEVINRLYEEGNYIVINTCRSGAFEIDACTFLEGEGVKYHYINHNPPHLIEKFGQDCRKISGDIYIDDKCLMGIPDDWEEIYDMIKGK